MILVPLLAVLALLAAWRFVGAVFRDRPFALGACLFALCWYNDDLRLFWLLVAYVGGTGLACWLVLRGVGLALRSVGERMSAYERRDGDDATQGQGAA